MSAGACRNSTEASIALQRMVVQKTKMDTTSRHIEVSPLWWRQIWISHSTLGIWNRPVEFHNGSIFRQTPADLLQREEAKSSSTREYDFWAFFKGSSDRIVIGSCSKCRINTEPRVKFRILRSSLVAHSNSERRGYMLRRSVPQCHSTLISNLRRFFLNVYLCGLIMNQLFLSIWDLNWTEALCVSGCLLLCATNTTPFHICAWVRFKPVRYQKVPQT